MPGGLCRRSSESKALRRHHSAYTVTDDDADGNTNGNTHERTDNSSYEPVAHCTPNKGALTDPNGNTNLESDRHAHPGTDSLA
jgi:sucrose-6-phosphate hydrolase SacC (GH32 family)